MLLLDEPTSSLDEAAKAEVEEVIRKIAGQGVTSILVTHDLGQARRLATRVAELRAGKLVRIGSVAEVLNAETSLS